jgi:alanine racemase
MFYTSYIELSKLALNHNIQYMRLKSGPNARYSMVIKGNAYGHGIEDVLPLVEACGVDHFAVFSAEEARRAYEAKQEHCDLMIMGFVDDRDLEWVIEHDISFFVFTLERLHATCEVSRRTKKKARIHVELETGMHRTGFCQPQFPQVIDMLKRSNRYVHLEGLCTHFAGAESMENFSRIKKQMKAFKAYCRYFQVQGLKPDYRHMACSAGVLNFPDSTLDMVRVGIANYGFWPNNETRMLHLHQGEKVVDPLHQVLSWKSKIMSLNQVEEGEYVSYGHSYLTNRDSKIATVPVGYGYGFSRTLSNNGHVLVNNKRVPVVGAVNMNMMVIDVTDLPHVQVNDEVVLIGKQGNLSISVTSFSDMNNSMNYELLTRLPPNIPRVTIA